MKHPLEPFATRFCCCCCILDPDVTCCVIAALCIAISAFSLFFNFGVGHWALCCISLVIFFIHLIAGVLLFLGGYAKNCVFKLTYCWMILVGLLFVIAAVILSIILHSEQFIIWGSSCHEFNKMLGLVLTILHSVWFIAFGIYSILIVLGNIHHTEGCVADSLSAYSA